jgi:LysM repeat protein
MASHALGVQTAYDALAKPKIASNKVGLDSPTPGANPISAKILVSDSLAGVGLAGVGVDFFVVEFFLAVVVVVFFDAKTMKSASSSRSSSSDSLSLMSVTFEMTKSEILRT